MKNDAPADGTLRLDAELLDDGEDYRLIRKKVMKEMYEEGVIISEQPLNPDGSARRPHNPEDFSSMTQDQIIDLLGQYTAWMEYLRGRIGFLRVKHDEAERRKNLVRAQLRLRKKGHQSDKSDAAMIDPRYQRLDKEEFEARAMLELAEATLEGAEYSKFVVSRAITSQGQELEAARREHNVAGNRGGEFKDYKLPPKFPRKRGPDE